MRTESTFCKRLKRFWLSSSVLNSLAPSYPFTFHFNFRFAYKQHLRKHSPALPFTCLPCLEKTKEGPKEIHRLQFKCMTVTPTYLVSKHPRVLQLQVNPAILAEWRSDRRYPWMRPRDYRARFHDTEGALNCRPGLLRGKAERTLEPWVTYGWKRPHLRRCLMRREERKAKVFPSAVNEQKMTCLSPLGVSKGSRQSILRARLEAHTGNHRDFPHCIDTRLLAMGLQPWPTLHRPWVWTAECANGRTCEWAWGEPGCWAEQSHTPSSPTLLWDGTSVGTAFRFQSTLCLPKYHKGFKVTASCLYCDV